jgi:hypothetical protein
MIRHAESARASVGGYLQIRDIVMALNPSTDKNPQARMWVFPRFPPHRGKDR